MVLESFVNPLNAERHPAQMLWIGMAYCMVGILLSFWVFRAYASLVMVSLTAIAAVPLMVATIKMEEKKDLVYKRESRLLKEHSKALKFFMYLFIGFVLAYSLAYVAFPTEMSTQLFEVQTETLNQINPSSTTGRVSAVPNAMGHFNRIFVNNVKVLIFCILFSFLYGAGAIFILSWNASVIGAAIGNFVESGIDALLVQFGLITAPSYFLVAMNGLARYAIHGIPEILAYFVAALAGGIISVAAINHDFGSKSFERIVFDSTELIILSVLIVFLAGILEVWVTPIFF